MSIAFLRILYGILYRSLNFALEKLDSGWKVIT